MYFMSLTEIVLLVLLFIFFLRSPGQMWFAFLHLPHLLRGIIGFKINKSIPRSYEIVEKLKPEDEEEGKKQITFEGFEMRMQTVILTTVKETYESVHGKLRAYFWLTIICGVLDIIDTVIQSMRFGVPGDEYSDIVLLTGCAIMIGINIYYIFWLYHTNSKLPEKMQSYTAGAMMGFGSKFQSHLNTNLTLVKSAVKKGKEGAGKGFRAAYGLNKAKKKRD